VTGFLLLLGLPSLGPAQSPGLEALEQRQAELAGEARSAVVELYGLDTRLATTQSELAALDAKAADLAQRRASARHRLDAARRTLLAAQEALGSQLRVLYQADQPDPIAIVLGARSLDDAIEGLETVRRTARATESIVSAARGAKAHLELARRTLADETSRNRAVRAELASTAADLAHARSERNGYLERIRREQELTAAQISSLERQAQAAREQAAAVVQPAQPSDDGLAAPAAPAGEAAAPSEPPPAPVESVSGDESTPPAAGPGPPRPGGTLSVYATGYCLRGTTATGLPVGPGIVAVDPTVIPLGTRMTIPGYGEGVAADVGSGIKGARIDVWIASCAQAAAFTRTVTITFH